MNLELLRPRMILINLFPCDPGFCTKERIAQTPYLLYIHSGKGLFYIDGVKYIARPGDLFFCPEGKINAIIADKDEPYVLSGIDFHFTDRNISQIKPEGTEAAAGADMSSPAQEPPSSLFDPVINLAADTGHDYLIHEMIESYKDSTILSLSYCNSLLKTFLLNVVYFRLSGRSVRNESSEVLKYLSEHSNVGLTIDELARQFNYHPCTINRIVKGATGLSAKEYQIGIRIKKAKSLLLYSGKSITEIALACGYNDVFFFSRQFKRKTSVLPSDFRKNRAVRMPDGLPPALL